MRRLPAALSTEHVRLSDLATDQAGYQLVASTVLRLLRTINSADAASTQMSAGGGEVAALAQSLKVMVQLVDEALAGLSEESRRAFVLGMHHAQLLDELLEAFESARRECDGMKPKPDYHGLLLKCGLRIACIVASPSTRGFIAEAGLDASTQWTRHLVSALSDSRTLLNFLNADLPRASFEHLLSEVFDALSFSAESGLHPTDTEDETSVDEARIALLLSMLNSRNKALLRCVGFLTRAIQRSRGVAAQKEVQMKLLLLRPNVLRQILHLVGEPRIDAKMRVSVASLILKLVQLPAGLQEVLAEAYEAGEVGNDAVDDVGYSSSTNTLFSSDAAAESHGTAEWLDRATDLAENLRDAIKSIEASRPDSTDEVEQLVNGMVLTAKARHNLATCARAQPRPASVVP